MSLHLHLTLHPWSSSWLSWGLLMMLITGIESGPPLTPALIHQHPSNQSEISADLCQPIRYEYYIVSTNQRWVLYIVSTNKKPEYLPSNIGTPSILSFHALCTGQYPSTTPEPSLIWSLDFWLLPWENYFRNKMFRTFSNTNGYNCILPLKFYHLVTNVMLISLIF